MAGEMMVGFFVGLSARLILSALQVAGTTIASQTGLAFAPAVDPAQGVQGAFVSNFLSITRYHADLRHRSASRGDCGIL